jgi:hypothetical protein
VPSQDWVGVLARAETDGTAVNTTIARTSLTPAHARFTTPTNGFWVVGKVLRLTAVGRVSTFTSGTLTLSFGVAAVDAWTSGALTMVASQTNITWRLRLDVTVRAVGAGGSATANLMGVGTLSGGLAYTGQPLLPSTAPAVGTSFDPAVASVLDLFATWSVSNASNSIQAHTYTLESLN